MVFQMDTVYIFGALLLTSLLAITNCRASDDNSDVIMGSLGGHHKDFPAGVGHLLFKHMRFRDLSNEESGSKDNLNTDEYRTWPERNQEDEIDAFIRDVRNSPSSARHLKRNQHEELVNNLAALLNDIKERTEDGSTLRMPSLRFG